MKNLLILYNLIFLLVGNVLILNVHNIIDHDHENHEQDECVECINLKFSNQYISDAKGIFFSPPPAFQFIDVFFSTIRFSSAKIYLSRAPPIS